uniref:Ig-like domain-containing protein n=1 Tax=Chelonoidis abingdonii TaxID=106734 RepID=A0A8C0ITN3_CHEAB
TEGRPDLCKTVTFCTRSIHFITLTQRPGETMKITCVQNETSYPYMYWYKQLQGEGPRLILWDFRKSKHLLCLSTSSGACPFLLLMMQPLVTVTNNKVYFGAGTKLTVLEDGLNITSPKVAIFPPSKQEIKEKGKATLVCLVRDFYPDHVKLVWQVNDADREDGVRTDEFSTWDDTSKSYSLTSRLRISTQEWFNSKNSFRCAVKFHLDEVQYEVIRGGDGE